MADGKRKGRPARSADGPANRTITMRVNERLYDEIAQEAEANNRSLTAQAERRLLHKETDLTRMVGALVEDAHRRLLDRGEQDRAVIDNECRRVAHVAVEIVYRGVEGPSDVDIDRLTRIKTKSEYENLEDDVWAPFRLAEVKIGGKIPE